MTDSWHRTIRFDARLIWLGVVIGVAGSGIVLADDWLRTRGQIIDPLLSFSIAGLGGGVTATGFARGRSLPRRALVAILGGLFAIWGTTAGVCGLYIISPVLCSLVWAGMLRPLFGEHATVPMLALGGLVTAGNLLILALFLLIEEFSSGTIDPRSEYLLGASMILWHLGHPVALRRAAEAWQLHTRGYNDCLACGYDVRGLPADVCPECGASLSRDTNNLDVA